MDVDNKINRFFIKEDLSIWIALLILIVSSVNMLISKSSADNIDNISRKYEESRKPVKISVIIVSDRECTYCYNVYGLINEIETENVIIGSRKDMNYLSEEANELIMKYEIEKIPALIIRGEIGKNRDLYARLSQIGEIMDNIFVYKKPGMPYVDVKTGKIVGAVKVTLISADDCSECYNQEKYVAELKILGIPTSNRETVDYRSNAGMIIVKENDIKKVPTFMLSGDLDKYPALKKIQDYDNNVFVLRSAIGPYMDLIYNKVY